MAGSDNALLSVRNLSVRYGAILALAGVSIEVRAGEVVSIIGANGAGKSTMIKAIMSLTRKAGGAVGFQGVDITAYPPYRVPRLGIGYVPEGRQLFGRMSVRENLEMGLVSLARARERANELSWVYRMFPVLETRAPQLAGTLSGGEQQMLAMGRALIARPALCLFDEPSLGLAPLVQQQVFQVIATLKREGVSSVLVEQNAKKALEISDRCYVLELGKVALAGRSEEIAQDPRVERAYLGG